LIQFTIKSDPQFGKKAQDLMPTANDCYQLAILQMTTIRQRTQSGLDVDGQQFAEYSEQTQKRKTELGRNPDLVDLTQQNRMLGQSMQTKRLNDGGVIFFADANRREIALIHNEGSGRMPKRTFFSVSHADAQALAKKLQELINARSR